MRVNNTGLIILVGSCQLVLGSPASNGRCGTCILAIIIAGNVDRGCLNGVVSVPHRLHCFWPVCDGPRCLTASKSRGEQIAI
jgi:hypothetical protein